MVGTITEITDVSRILANFQLIEYFQYILHWFSKSLS
jgi:hypothetical protein